LALLPINVDEATVKGSSGGALGDLTFGGGRCGRPPHHTGEIVKRSLLLS